MPQFLITAKDGTDEGALERRLKARDAHIANTDASITHMIMGAATLNEAGQMNGSSMIVEFDTRADLDAWLTTEPYVVQNVWHEIAITECRVGPSFKKKEQA